MAPVAPSPVDELARALTESIRQAQQRDGQKAQYLGRYGDFASGFKHDALGTPISVGYSHGDGGNLSFPGVDPAIFHTVVGNRGMLGQLPVVSSVYTNPTFTVITGVTGDTGSEKTDVCDDAPVAGLTQAATLASVFGRYERATATLELNRLGQRLDRSDPMDLSLVGSPISQTGLFTNGPGDPNVPGDIFTNEVGRKFWELSVSLHRLLSVQLWQGNPANNSAGGGYKESTGLDMLITTGNVDILTGSAVPAVDSDVKEFGYLNVADNGGAIVNALTYLYYTRRDLAERTGVMPVRWVFCMKPEVFYELSAVWPCAYLTYRCELAGIDGARLNIDGAEQSRMRDDMRNGRYLLIDGNRVEVVLDDGIAESNSTNDANVTEGCFASDIYLIPMSVIGGRAVTYMETMDYNNPSLQAALGGANMILGRVEGPWITVPKQTNLCIQWQTKIEPRVICRTPWLAGRLNHVVVCPLQRTASPFPDSPYHLTGGVTSRPGPSFHQLWS